MGKPAKTTKPARTAKPAKKAASPVVKKKPGIRHAHQGLKLREVTAAEKARFLECLADYPSIMDAAQRAEVDRRLMYREKAKDPDFAAAWKEARRQGIAVLENVAVRRAVVGHPEPVIYQGKIQVDENGEPVTVLRPSDTLLIFLMKAGDRKKYQDTSSVALTGEDGGPLEVRSWHDVMKTVAAGLVIEGESTRVE